VRTEDFILSQNDLFSNGPESRFTHSILNPPYKKINSNSVHRSVLRSVGIESSNLYSGFVSLSLEMLENGGELVGITPRSFCNGPYFRPFRELILQKTSIVQIHLFGSRTDSFRGDDVLQENVIFHLVKGESQKDVIVSSSSDSSFSDLLKRSVPFSEFCFPRDPESVFHLVRDEDDDDEMKRLMRVYSHRLTDLGLSVSTGPVVDFRLRSSLKNEGKENTVPLFYPFHFDKGQVRHPVDNPKKPQFIEVNDDTKKWLSLRGNYVLVRRLSSKEEKRRVVPTVLFETDTEGTLVGLENHLNFFHQEKRGIPEPLCVGLSLYLGSTFVDRWIRRFSGHTQVNSTDLRSLGYPSRKVLTGWGKKYSTTMSQDEIDSIVNVGTL
jgi:adenine-specific DNA-methyltransferase